MDEERIKRDLYEQITADIMQRFQQELLENKQKIYEQKAEIHRLNERLIQLEETIMWAAYNLNQSL